MHACFRNLQDFSKFALHLVDLDTWLILQVHRIGRILNITKLSHRYGCAKFW